MQGFLMILPVVVPALFWAAYHYHKDRDLPEPLGNLALCFGLGVVSAFVSQAAYRGLEPLGLRYDAVALGADHPLGLLLYALLAIGPIEELAKLLPFVLVVIRFSAFDEPVDGIIYASFIGLGYAAIENFHYLELLTTGEAIARGFAGPVIHMLFASIWAYWIAKASLAGKRILPAAVVGGTLAASLHGLYDFLVLLEPVSALPVAAMLIVGLWVWRLRAIQRLVGAGRTRGAPEQ